MPTGHSVPMRAWHVILAVVVGFSVTIGIAFALAMRHNVSIVQWTTIVIAHMIFFFFFGWIFLPKNERGIVSKRLHQA